MKPVRAADVMGAQPVDWRGRRTPAVRLALDERDRYLIEAARFYPNVSDREIARLLRAALKIYRGGRWRRDASEALCPVQYEGKLTAVLWMLLKCRDAPPPSERTIRQVLGLAALGHHADERLQN